jgi:hypothetical protein
MHIPNAKSRMIAVSGRVVLFRRCLIQSILIDSREPVTPKCDGAAMMLMLMVPGGVAGAGRGG